MTSLLLMLALTLSAHAPLQAGSQAAPDLSGTWQLSAVTAQGTQAATLVLKKDGDKYSASLVGPDGTTLPAQVTVKDKTVTVTLTTESNNGPRTITLTGTIDGDSISGTADNGRGGTAPFTGKRAAASAPDVTGTWSVTVTTDQGGGTPTFVLKQEGEKLSGQYKGQFGEAPVTGTIKGNDIAFIVQVTVEGNTARITYTGTVSGDTMEGKVSLADLAAGTFKGTRKP